MEVVSKVFVNVILVFQEELPQPPPSSHPIIGTIQHWICVNKIDPSGHGNQRWLAGTPIDWPPLVSAAFDKAKVLHGRKRWNSATWLLDLPWHTVYLAGSPYRCSLTTAMEIKYESMCIRLYCISVLYAPVLYNIRRRQQEQGGRVREKVLFPLPGGWEKWKLNFSPHPFP